MYRRIYSAFKAPFQLYNDALSKHPLATKSLTSGVLFAGGDFLAQIAEHSAKLQQKNAAVKEMTTKPKIDFRRMFIFFFYGSIIAGPGYHFWYNFLDKTPTMILMLKRHVAKLSSLLSGSFEVHSGSPLVIFFRGLRSFPMRYRKSDLPICRPPSSREILGAQIFADQFLFGNVILFLFFMTTKTLLGMGEAYDVLEQSSSMVDVRFCNQIPGITTPSTTNVGMVDSFRFSDKVDALSRRVCNSTDGTRQIKYVSSTLPQDTATDHNPLPAAMQSLQRVYDKIVHTSEAVEKQLTMADIIQRAWNHTSAVYLSTFAADTVVWIPLQYINFRFVAVSYQFLFVNTAALFWNTFLSLVANTREASSSQ